MLRPLVDSPAILGGRDIAMTGVGGARLAATRWSPVVEPQADAQPTPPVLLLHGLASSRRFWNLVVHGLGGLEVAAVDQRGHGESERPDGPYDSATVVADAVAVLDQLGWERAVVVGHSWGAGTALRVAASAPGRVAAVAAIDGGFGSPQVTGADREQLRLRLTPPRTALPPERLLAAAGTGVLAPWWDEAVAAAMLPLFAVGEDGLARARLPFEAHMAIVDDLLATPAPEFAAIRCPAWLVACTSGAGDEWTQAQLAGLDRAGAALTQPRLQRWTGAVHDVPLQWPALVSGLVRAAAEEAARFDVAATTGAPLQETP